MEYDEFIKSKETRILNSGFNIDIDQLNSKSFEYQKVITKWAIKKGRAAIFAEFI
jgi:hypothetical protein